MFLSLIGYRGTGKSTTARHLAPLLRCEWIDADAEAERVAGKSIADIFSQQGEPAFRDLEERVLADLTARDNLILACGGGAVLREANRMALRRAGHVVWLRASMATIAARLAADAAAGANRPNLTAAGGIAEIEQLLASREPLYQACATLTIDADRADPAAIADQIAAWIKDGG